MLKKRRKYVIIYYNYNSLTYGENNGDSIRPSIYR